MERTIYNVAPNYEVLDRITDEEIDGALSEMGMSRADLECGPDAGKNDTIRFALCALFARIAGDEDPVGWDNTPEGVRRFYHRATAAEAGDIPPEPGQVDVSINIAEA